MENVLFKKIAEKLRNGKCPFKKMTGRLRNGNKTIRNII